MTRLDGPAFARFFESVHGFEPYPWQVRLVDQVLGESRWPDLLDLPTGAGKTSAIDAAVFTLAARPDDFPRRIALVVDRRVIVDQGAVHVRMIQAALHEPRDDAVREVASRLRAMAGDGEGPPLTVSVLRGGMPRDEAWIRTPDTPTVVLSTVDQVGSRLLFRGYGVSPRMAPIHAGLLGNDTLFLLDEVQLSTAFAETLAALRNRWRDWRNRGDDLPDRWAVVALSATPLGVDPTRSRRFELGADDRAHPRMARRLSARKLARLNDVPVSGDEAARRDRFARACIRAVEAHLSEGARTVAVVLNRVDGARRVRRLLAEADGSGSRVEATLLTGRMRPLDRSAVLGDPGDPTSLVSRISAGRDREASRPPTVVVATQSIEAGADFDFDALVTECASLDALRQRFGRLDRAGNLGTSRATILVRRDQLGADPDPIYRSALAGTWKWLVEHARRSGTEEVDFGAEALPAPTDEERKVLGSPPVPAPVLLPAHLDAWVQTQPRPEPDPDVALWLHGPERGVDEVRVVWRGDVDSDRLNGEGDEPARHVDELVGSLTACPPSSLESLSVPIGAVRAFLERAEFATEEFGDVEALTDAPPARTRHESGRRCIRFAAGRPTLAAARDLAPEDTIVVPASYGGIAFGTWDPEADVPVSDLGDWANLLQRGSPVLRLHPDVLAGAGPDDPSGSETPPVQEYCPRELAVGTPRTSGLEDPEQGAWEAIEDWAARLDGRADHRLALLVELLVRERRKSRTTLVDLPGDRLALVGRRRLDAARLRSHGAPDVAAGVAGDDEDGTSFIGQDVPLSVHLDDVRRTASAFAERLGLAPELTRDLGLAAWLHDVGKADPRFQRLLVGGDEVRAALLEAPLAKSRIPAGDLRSRRAAAEAAGYPRGYRHELLSVQMLERTPEALEAAHDPDLVLHLVGSHHGWCRPFAPAVADGPSLDVELELGEHRLRGVTAHGLARLDSGVGDRFWSLVERYGWWGLAWLEAIVRLADHRASESPTLDSEERGSSIPTAAASGHRSETTS